MKDIKAKQTKAAAKKKYQKPTVTVRVVELSGVW
jgi:hypothetical protein